MERTFLYEDEHLLETGYHDIIGVDGERYFGRRYSKESMYVKVIIDDEWLELILKNNIDGTYKCYVVTNIPTGEPRLFDYKFMTLSLNELKNIKNIEIPFPTMTWKLQHVSITDSTTPESFYENNKLRIKEIIEDFNE